MPLILCCVQKLKAGTGSDHPIRYKEIINFYVYKMLSSVLKWIYTYPLPVKSNYDHRAISKPIAQLQIDCTTVTTVTHTSHKLEKQFRSAAEWRRFASFITRRGKCTHSRHKQSLTANVKKLNYYEKENLRWVGRCFRSFREPEEP